MSILTVERDQLLRHGEKHVIISGAVHYFRIHPAQWRDRLRRLVAMGCNTVETYVAWNFHAPSPTEVTFTGWADLSRFLGIAQEEGLDAIVRPGPYICAEWEGGGLPGWLQADGPIEMRCLSRPWLDHVDRWFDRLIPIIAEHQSSRGGNVVAFQVENEYGSFGDDHAYMEFLRDGLRARGVDELLVTSDGPGRGWLTGGTVPGAWATVNYGSDTERVLQLVREELPDQPLMCMEFWNGWFDHWGEQHHTRSAESAAGELQTMLDNGVSVNFYMAHGGTNFGLWAGANHSESLEPTVTSYDYDAPIAEDGALTEKFLAFRQVIARHVELPPLDRHLADLGLQAAPDRLEGRDMPWENRASLQHLPVWHTEGQVHSRALTFEKAGLERGMLLARRDIEVNRPAGDRHWGDEIPPLVFYGLTDRVTVLLNGHCAGVVNPATSPGYAAPQFEFTPHRDLLLPQGAQRARVRVELLLENQGRCNFGPHLGTLKGITHGVWYGYRYLNDWHVTAMPLELMGEQLWEQAVAYSRKDAVSSEPEQTSAPVGDESERLPLVLTTLLHSEREADAYIDTSCCGRGVIWIDDFCLGRYSNAGPQQTLYVPAPLLTPGEHRITVLELETADPHLSLASEPRLG